MGESEVTTRTSEAEPRSIIRRMVPLPSPVKRAVRPARRRFRYATRTRRILPSFLIIGAQRAGTTSLFRYLLATRTSPARAAATQRSGG